MTSAINISMTEASGSENVKDSASSSPPPNTYTHTHKHTHLCDFYTTSEMPHDQENL
jgi:hypothetical protein